MSARPDNCTHRCETAACCPRSPHCLSPASPTLAIALAVHQRARVGHPAIAQPKTRQPFPTMREHHEAAVSACVRALKRVIASDPMVPLDWRMVESIAREETMQLALDYSQVRERVK